MPRLRFLAAVLVTAALSGCASPQVLNARREHLLSAAGFHLRPATTPQVRAQLAALAPQRLVWQDHLGKLSFLYADPDACHCLFVGSERAYQTYRRMQFQRQIATRNKQAAQMNLNAAGWWPWGAPPPYGWW